MTLQNLRRVGALVLIALVAIAGWQFSRHPVFAAIVLAVVGSVGILQWRSLAAFRLVREAGLRCDVATLTELATRGSQLSRVHAIVAATHHGSVDAVPPAMCTCGRCEKDLFDTEVETIRRIVRLAWGGFGVKAYDLAREQELDDPKLRAPYREVITTFRIMTRLVSYAGAASEEPSSDGSASSPHWFELSVKAIEVGSPALRWPARLAAAREAASRGDHAAAKSLLDGMPAWPEGSMLEARRRELLSD